MLNRRTVRLSRRVCFCSFCHMVCECVAYFSFSLCSCTLRCTYQYAFSSTAPTRTAAVALPMRTHEGCCCRWTNDLQHAPWLLLLLFVVDLLIVLCCSFAIAITHLMRWYEHMRDFFQLHMTSSISMLLFAFFYSPGQLRTICTSTRTAAC